MNVRETAVITKIAFGPWPHWELTDEILAAYHMGLQGLDYEDAHRGVGFALRVAIFPPPPSAIRAEAMRFVHQRRERRITARRLRLLSVPEVPDEKVRAFIDELKLVVLKGKEVA